MDLLNFLKTQFLEEFRVMKAQDCKITGLIAGSEDNVKEKKKKSDSRNVNK